jgi:PAS domain S-box-containing protein
VESIASKRDGLPPSWRLAPSREATAQASAADAIDASRDHELDRRLESMAEVFDDSPEAVLVVDREGRLRYANPACALLVGVAADRLVGRPVAEYAVHHDDAIASVESGTDGSPGCVLRGRLDLRRPDGELRWVSWSASPLRGSDGTGVGAVAFLRDDTDRRREEVRWTRRHDELEQAIRTVAHDLRSPLVAVLGFSRLLREDFGGVLGERGAHYLERVVEAGRTMEALIRELLDFTRIGHAGERPALVDAREVLEQLRGELKPRFDADGVELSISEQPPLVHCDRTRLYQLFSNLLGNALDHMGECEKPRITVDVREDGAWHRLTVSDNGRGIAREEQERIFEMFHTIPREGGRKGTGIGLAIVKKIAELHGGRVCVESAPSQGAAFHVFLPRP